MDLKATDRSEQGLNPSGCCSVLKAHIAVTALEKASCLQLNVQGLHYLSPSFMLTPLGAQSKRPKEPETQVLLGHPPEASGVWSEAARPPHPGTQEEGVVRRVTPRP